MKKLKFIVGGQPFRSTDFRVIQDNLTNSVLKIIKSASVSFCVLAGIEYDLSLDLNPGEEFDVTQGFVFDGSEICTVAAASFNYDAAKSLYLRAIQTDSSPRSVGGLPVNVMEETTYQVVYVTTPAPGDVALDGIERLSIATSVKLTPAEQHPITTGAGFTSADGVIPYADAFGDVTLKCTFTASSATGTLCTLPEELRPSFTWYGAFKAGSGIGAIEIRTNGEIAITGASTTATNYITFNFKTI